MRVLLRQGGVVAKLYWVKRDTDKIVGWFDGGNFTATLNLPPETKIDIHFTYPRDGNLHHSMKYFNVEDGDWHYWNAYREKVNLKKINKDSGNRTMIETNRTDFPNLLSHMVPTSTLPKIAAFKEMPLLHQFPLQAVPVIDGVVKLGKMEVLSNFTVPRKDDLLIDTKDYPNAILNVSAFLIGNGSSHAFNGSDFLVVEDKREFPTVAIGCRVFNR